MCPSVVSQAANFKLCFYGNALKNMFDIISASRVFTTEVELSWVLVVLFCLVVVCLFSLHLGLRVICWSLLSRKQGQLCLRQNFS